MFSLAALLSFDNVNFFQQNVPEKAVKFTLLNFICMDYVKRVLRKTKENTTTNKHIIGYATTKLNTLIAKGSHIYL